jgi:hypothetical protein
MKSKFDFEKFGRYMWKEVLNTDGYPSFEDDDHLDKAAACGLCEKRVVTEGSKMHVSPYLEVGDDYWHWIAKEDDCKEVG